MMPTNKRSKPSSDPSYTTAKQNTSLVPTAVNTKMDTEELDLHYMTEDTKLHQKKKGKQSSCWSHLIPQQWWLSLTILMLITICFPSYEHD